MIKSVICLWILAFVTINAVRFELNDNIRNLLARVKFSDLPQSVQWSLTTNQGRVANDASHWCCINEQPVTTETETKIEYSTRVVTTKTKVGYLDCGLGGFWKCSQWVTTTRTEVYSFIQTFQVPNLAACSATDMKCCSGYMLVAGNCHAISELVENQELFHFLTNLGLLGGGIGK